jgi:hypothetical protein
LWTRLNPLVAVFGKKNQIELLPFEEPLAELDRRIEEVFYTFQAMFYTFNNCLG